MRTRVGERRYMAGPDGGSTVVVRVTSKQRKLRGEETRVVSIIYESGALLDRPATVLASALGEEVK